MNLREAVIEKLKGVYDPEIPVDIYNLGLIYDIGFEECAKGYYCNITMTFTTPNCPAADQILYHMNYTLTSIPEVYKVKIDLTFDPPWDKSKISDEGQDILIMEGN